MTIRQNHGALVTLENQSFAATMVPRRPAARRR
jgi:hypothetical protein